MTRKYLFLDFDGVLHPESAHATAPFALAPALADCLGDNACEIVISSSWRFSHTSAEILALLPTVLAKRVRGMTGPVQMGRHGRHQEIKSYRTMHGLSTGTSWRALDDCGWEFPPGTKELILCDSNVGLQSTQLEAIRAWLQAQDQ